MPIQSDKPFNLVARTLLIDTPKPAEEQTTAGEVEDGYLFEDGTQFTFEDGAPFQFND